MTDKTIDALNDVTKTLIDSQKGYQKAAEITADDHAVLSAEFSRRSAERLNLVGRFQQQVVSMGGEPQDDGGMAGSAHRAWTDFSSMFTSDADAALEAIDDGEDHLAEAIEKKLEDEDVAVAVRPLLQEALASAREGERFADRLEELR